MSKTMDSYFLKEETWEKASKVSTDKNFLKPQRCWQLTPSRLF